MQTWTFPEHHPSSDGPWRDEPDKAQWVDEATDLDCLAVRNHSGAWCGYVGIPPGHPWYDKPYGDIDADAHGSLTYGERCRDEDPEPAVCHVPEPGRPADVYWIGFDCAHAWDLIPRFAGETFYPWGPETTYKTLEYVRAECAQLAAQAAASSK